MRIRVSGKDKKDIIHVIEIVISRSRKNVIQYILYLPHCHNNYKMFHKWPKWHDSCRIHRFLPLHRIGQHHPLYKQASSELHIRLLHQDLHHTTHHCMEKHRYRYCSRWILSMSKIKFICLCSIVYSKFYLSNKKNWKVNLTFWYW